MPRKALLIGCNKFQESSGFPSLRYSERDATRFRNILLDPDRGYFDQAEPLLSPLEGEARKKLVKSCNDCTQDDLFLFYFSGHGKLVRNGDVSLILRDTESDLLDATITSSELIRLFNNCRARQKIIILDCCYSGAIGSAGIKAADADASLLYLQESTRGTHVLTASTRFQAAYEEESIEASILTSWLIEGIKSGRAGDPRSDLITLTQLVDFAQREISLTGKQRPTYWANESSGSIVIAKKSRTFDEIWAKEARRVVAGHVYSGNIAEETVDAIHKTLREREEVPDAPRLQLIDNLVADQIKPGLFLKFWFDLDRADAERIAAAREAELRAEAQREAAREAELRVEAGRAEAQRVAAREAELRAEAGRVEAQRVAAREAELRAGAKRLEAQRAAAKRATTQPKTLVSAEAAAERAKSQTERAKRRAPGDEAAERANAEGEKAGIRDVGVVVEGKEAKANQVEAPIVHPLPSDSFGFRRGSIENRDPGFALWVFLISIFISLTFVFLFNSIVSH